MRNISFLIGTAFLFFISCSHERSIEILYPEMIHSVSDFGNSIFFQEVMDIEYANDSFYFLDGSINTIFQTDAEFQLVNQFVEEGGAEFEATGLGSMYLLENDMYISDVSEGKLMRFDTNGQFIESFKVGLLGVGEFMIMHEHLIFFNDDYAAKQNPLVAFNLSDRNHQNFGKEAERILNNPDRHILPFKEDYFVTVYAENAPIIDLYNHSSFELQSSFNLKDLPLFKDVLNYYEEKVQLDPMMDIVLIPDVFIEGNGLYLLVSNMDVKQEWSSNTVLYCEILDGSITLEKIYKLKMNGWYESLMVKDNILYCADNGGVTIDSYRIK